jgi:hypothetical protein
MIGWRNIPMALIESALHWQCMFRRRNFRMTSQFHMSTGLVSGKKLLFFQMIVIQREIRIV